jgi:hypothetical protein
LWSLSIPRTKTKTVTHIIPVNAVIQTMTNEHAQEAIPVTNGIRSTTLAPMKMVGFLMTPTTFDEAWRVAQVLSKTDFAPKDMRGRPEAVLACLSMGAELGLSPMQALSSISVINGKPGLYGDGLLGVVRRDPSIVEISETATHNWNDKEPKDLDDPLWDSYVATCTVRRERNGKVEETSRSFSVPQAKRAKLWKRRGKDGQDTPWITYPERMLQMRARAIAIRDAAADITRGIGMVEELQDIGDPMRNVTPIGDHVPGADETPEMTEKIFSLAAEQGIKRAQIALEIKRDGPAVVLDRLQKTISTEPVVSPTTEPSPEDTVETEAKASQATMATLFALLKTLDIGQPKKGLRGVAREQEIERCKARRLAFAADVSLDGEPILVHSYSDLTEKQANALITEARRRLEEKQTAGLTVAQEECPLCGVGAGQAHFGSCENA